MSPLLAPPILDVEASGFGPGSYPIEIGYVLGDGTAYCTLISPAISWTQGCRSRLACDLRRRAPTCPPGGRPNIPHPI